MPRPGNGATTRRAPFQSSITRTSARSTTSGIRVASTSVMKFPPATPDTAASRVTKAVLAGDVVFFLDRTTLMAQRFDTTRLSPIGAPVRVAENVEPGVPGEAAFDASPAGTVTYRQLAPARLAQLTWLDRGGRPIGHVGEPGPNITIWISPDRRFALAEQWGARGTPSSRTASRIDLETGAAARLFANAAAPIWSPDGSRIAFTQFLAEPGPTVMVAAVDGTSPPRRSSSGRAHRQPTGRTMAASTLHTDADWIRAGELAFDAPTAFVPPRGVACALPGVLGQERRTDRSRRHAAQQAVCDPAERRGRGRQSCVRAVPHACPA
jgi:hypothetical protein